MARKNLGGRPKRTDKPRRITLLLSTKTTTLLDKLSLEHASRGRYVETLIEAAAKRAARRK